MSRRLGTVLPALVLLLAAGGAGAAPPDQVELKNGRTLEGEVVSDEGDSITVRVDGGVVTFPRSLVSRVVRGEGGGAAATSTPEGGAARGGGTAGADRVAALPVASEEWSLLLAGDRRVGWRHCQARSDEEGYVFEEESVFLDAEGGVEARTRLLEEAGLDLYPRGFVFREEAGGKESLRSARLVKGRLQVRTLVDGVENLADLAVPAGFRLPMAARAFVLRESAGLPGGWKGTTYDPRSGTFQELALKVSHRERVLWEGEARDVSVLVRTRGTVREEERVDDAGGTLTAELNGPALVAVRTTSERAEAVGAGKALDPSVEEVRARSEFVSDEAGFRIRKPGIAWEFVPGEARSNPRLTIRDVGGMVFVTISVEDAPEGATVAGTGAALERKFSTRSAEYKRVEDGFVRLDDREAFRLVCDARLKGDQVRTLAITSLRGGRAWTLAATCPISAWEEALPHIERILAAFRWI